MSSPQNRTHENMSEPVADELSRRVLTHRNKLLGTLAALSAVSVAAFAVLASLDIQDRTLGFEGAKILAQFGLVAVGGAIISLLAFQYQTWHQQMEKQRDLERAAEEKSLERLRGRIAIHEQLLRDVLAAATQSYTNVKRSRRTLRARGTDKSGDRSELLLASEYDEQMDAISVAQIQFETLREDVRTSPSIFAAPDELIKDFDFIEQRLHLLIAEYEEQRPQFGSSETRRREEFPALKVFLARNADEPAEFRRGFLPVTSSMERIRQRLREDLRVLAQQID